MKHFVIGAAMALLAAHSLAGHHEESEQPATADDAMMQAMQAAATPGEAHQMLAKGVGSFTAEMRMYMAPGAEPMVTQMDLERSMDLDGRVMVEQWQGNVMGQPFEGRGRTGYDNVTKTFWSTWSDNMSTALLVFKGQADADSEDLVMTAEGVHAVTGMPYKMRSVASRTDDGKELMTMYEDHGQGEFKTMSFVLTPK
ncbi:MAG: DUF1579 family protein [Pseudomonadota bacterium]